MVTEVPPVLVMVSLRVLLLPTVTLPKLRLVGFDPRVPGETPVPDSGMVSVAFEALEVIVMVPLAVVAEVGVKMPPKVAD